ncbi:MFS transporter [Rathayibacter sp. VKM Ac-2760]|uniref:MFS transporter n=1 Tax=Rathayibacter sp. VKM Ac-2760 TaxID=2609253 RepID=UPI0013172092|nr:MFS transporter [Rathayibacter sp. VKM Ac-2760]QHC58679.1 MFS transporter [Rathayibacter sp. VKM Ac-2760]
MFRYTGPGDGPSDRRARGRRPRLLTRRPGRVATAAGVGTTVVTVLPVFLVGGLSVQLAEDTGLGPALLGIVVAVYWASAAVFSSSAGRLSARIGSRLGMITAASLGGVALLGTAAWAPEWPWLVVWLVVAGAGNAIGHPPSNALIASRVSDRNRAFAFGLKQAAIPLATLCAGLAVPTLALTVGWRWTFAIAGIVACIVIVVVALSVPSVPPLPRMRGKRANRLPPELMRFLLLASLASALGSAQANVIGAFTVSTATSVGYSAAAAGLILSLGSVAGVIARPVAGLAADRGFGGTMATVSLMLGSGAVGLGGMAVGLPWSFAIGCILAFGLGWGWNGLLHYVVSHSSHPHSARATGIVQSGAYVGSAAGPLVFGFLFDHAGTTVGWTAAAIVAAVAALAALVAHHFRPGAAGIRTAPMKGRTA